MFIVTLVVGKIVFALADGTPSSVRTRATFFRVLQPGGGGVIGAVQVARAEPDGYTILANSSTHTVTPATRSNLGFEMTDLAAVIPLGNMPVVFVVNPSKGYKQLSDFVAAAKAFVDASPATVSRSPSRPSSASSTPTART